MPSDSPAPIPLVDLRANMASIREEVDAAVGNVFDTCAFILGPDVKAFEESFAEYVGVKHCIGVGNGTDALQLALEALSVGPGDEVVTQSNTFVATVLAISAVGATPVLVDVDPSDLAATTESFRAAITERTRCVIPVHLFGACGDVAAIAELCRERGIPMLEDTSQAHGAYFDGKRLGSFGSAATFSFYPGKNLGALGDGGCVVTNDDAVAEALRFRRNWGSTKKYHHEVKGFNSRLDTVQAAVLRIKLRNLDAWNANRVRAAAAYSAALAGVGDLRLPACHDKCNPVWHLYVIRTARRDALLEHLHQAKIGAGIHYPIPIHKLGAYADEFKDQSFPNAELAAETMISLPMFPEITTEQIDRVVACVRDFFSKRDRE